MDNSTERLLSGDMLFRIMSIEIQKGHGSYYG